MEFLYLLGGAVIVYLIIFSNRDSMGNVGEEIIDPRIEKQEFERLRKTKKYVYLHPVYGALSWDGAGKTPNWVTEYLSAGGDLQDLESPSCQHREEAND